eukprot:3877149-Ditylum_brightwellii.AAC.1
MSIFNFKLGNDGNCTENISMPKKSHGKNVPGSALQDSQEGWKSFGGTSHEREIPQYTHRLLQYALLPQ